MRCWLVLILVTATHGAAMLAPAEPLAPGVSRTLRLTADTGLVLPVTCEAAGLLSAFTRGAGGDVVLTLRDPDSQPVQDCESDDDYEGEPANEQLAGTVAYPGVWQLVVSNTGDTDSLITLGLAWQPAPSLAVRPWPHSRVADALPAEADDAWDVHLNSAQRRRWMWYALTAPRTGRLTVSAARHTDPAAGAGSGAVASAFGLTEAPPPPGSLALRVVTGERHEILVDESDDEDAASLAAPRLTFRVVVGQRYWIRLSLLGGGSGSFRLETSLAR